MRAALPRIRIDHMLDLNWKFLVPVSLAAVVFTIVVDKVFQLYAPTDSEWARAGVLFLANVLLAWITYWLVVGIGPPPAPRRRGRSGRAGRLRGHGDTTIVEHAHTGDGHSRRACAPSPAH